MFWHQPVPEYSSFLLHAVATPITAILLNTALLKEQRLNPHETDLCLINIDTQRRYLQQLIDPDQTNLAISFNALTALREVVKLHHRPFVGEFVELFDEYKPSRITGNQILFQEMISCLIKNGLESYGNAPIKKVDVFYRVTGQKCEMKIVDYGAGWSKLNQWRSRWLRYSHKQSHGGIGWRLCRSVITKLGGTVTIASRKNQGTTITLELCIQTPEPF